MPARADGHVPVVLLRRQRFSSPHNLGYTYPMRRILLPAALFLVSLIIYLLTLAPTVATIFDDSLELQLAVPTLAIIHPTGYPLYELLAWMTTRLLPVGDAAYRVNFFSALAAALAVALAYLVARRLGARPLPAAVGALLLAVSPVWWSQATIAEVYTFQGLIALLVWWAALGWEQAVTAARPKEAARWLLLLGFAIVMGLAHHRLTLLLLPGILLFLLWTDPALWRQPRRWVAPLLALALPLATYTLLPLRAHVGSLDGAYAQLGFWKWIMGGGYGAAFILDNPFGVERTLVDLLQLARMQFGWLGIIVILFSLPWWRRHPRRALLLALTALIQLLFARVYKVQDIEVFLIPLFLIMALWIALGLDQMGVWLSATGTVGKGRQRVVMAAGAAVLLLWPGMRASAHWQEADRSQPPIRAWGVHDLGIDMLSSAGPDGRVIGLLGEMTLIRYFQYDRGLYPAVETVAADDDALRLEAVTDSLAEDRPTYTTRPLSGLPERFSLGARGALIRVFPPGEAAWPEPAQRTDVALLPQVRLTGWAALLREPRSGMSLRVLLWWQAEDHPPAFKVSTRLLAPDGALLAQQDAIPVYNSYPSSLWRPGETVLDAYNLAIDSPPPAGASLLIILYDPMSGQEMARWQTPLQN